MSFQAPLFLTALVLLPLAAVLYARRERRTTAARTAFAPRELLPSVAPRRPGWRRHAAPVGYGVALAVLVIALARPQATVAVPVEQATLMIVTDRSASMRAEDVAPTRLEAARRAADTFLEEVPRGLRVGAIAFNDRVQVLQRPTEDREAVREAMAGIEAAGSTATGDALAGALRQIRASAPADDDRVPAAIVLLADGESRVGRDPLAVAAEAERAGVPVYTVALGTPEGTIQVRTRNGVETRPVPPDVETLRAIARRSGGEAYAVADADRLRQVYDRIGSQVATERRPREVTGMFAGGALLLLAGAAAASLRWFGRVL